MSLGLIFDIKYGVLSENIQRIIDSGETIDKEMLELWVKHASHIEYERECAEERVCASEEGAPMTAEIDEDGVMCFYSNHNSTQADRLMEWFKKHKHDKFDDVKIAYSIGPTCDE